MGQVYRHGRFPSNPLNNLPLPDLDAIYRQRKEEDCRGQFGKGRKKIVVANQDPIWVGAGCTQIFAAHTKSR